MITTGDSLHWMDWYAVLPCFAQLLTANGYWLFWKLGNSRLSACSRERMSQDDATAF